MGIRRRPGLQRRKARKRMKKTPMAHQLSFINARRKWFKKHRHAPVTAYARWIQNYSLPPRHPLKSGMALRFQRHVHQVFHKAGFISLFRRIFHPALSECWAGSSSRRVHHGGVSGLVRRHRRKHHGIVTSPRWYGLHRHSWPWKQGQTSSQNDNCQLEISQFICSLRLHLKPNNVIHEPLQFRSRTFTNGKTEFSHRAAGSKTSRAIPAK